jgi:hypothetical protein
MERKGVLKSRELVTYSVSTDNSINQVPAQQDSSLGHSEYELNLQSLVPSLLPPTFPQVYLCSPSKIRNEISGEHETIQRRGMEDGDDVRVNELVRLDSILVNSEEA